MTEASLTIRTQAELREILDKPLPSEALKLNNSKGYDMTSINPIYVVERLNDAFGIGGWTIHTVPVTTVTTEKTDKKTGEVYGAKTMIVVHSVLTADVYGVRIESYGGNDNPDLGDAYKGACTDALTKIGSYLGIGAHVWRNENVPTNRPTERKTSPPPTTNGATTGIRYQIVDGLAKAYDKRVELRGLGCEFDKALAKSGAWTARAGAVNMESVEDLGLSLVEI